MAARLEIEITGNNAGLKRILEDSLSQLSSFNKALDFNPGGVKAVNNALYATRDILREIVRLSSSVKGSIANLTLSDSSTKELDDARVSSENYRTESAKLASQLQALRLQQAQNKVQTDAASGSYTEAKRRLSELGTSIKNSEGGFRSATPAIKAQIVEYKKLNSEIKEFDAGMRNAPKNTNNSKSTLQGIQSVAATYLGFSALLATGKEIVKTNAEISDSIADVRRTAGLTAKEADNLATSLKSIDTRTNLKDLLGISVIGGQLGIAKDQLAGFTKAVDELAVTLGGELKGGADGIATSLGVIDNIFKVTQSNSGNVEKSYNQIGSAILGLGQSGLATGDFLADFAERVGGVAKQAGISLPVILSYGAVLQENGVNAEVAGSSFKRLISALSSNSAGFFQIAKFADANLTLKDFNTLVNTDTKRALDLFFQGINKGGASTIAFGTILKSLKIAGSGASQSVSAIANNLSELDDHIKQSTIDMNQGVLSAEQFAIKNDNLAASIAKLGNEFTKITTSGAIASLFKGITDGMVNALNKLNKLINSESWKEFWTRFTNSNPIGSDIIDWGKAFQQVSKKNNDNQKFIFGNDASSVDTKLKDLGAFKFNAYLGNVKKTYEQSATAYAEYAGAVKSGRVKEQKETVDQYKHQYERAKSYYDQLTILQNKFGFTPAVSKTKERSNIDAPNLKKDKKAKLPPENRANDILTKSNNSAENAGVDGVKERLQKLDQVYAGYYKDLNDNAKKSAEGRATLERDRATLEANKTKERSAILISEAQRVANEISRINNEAGIVIAQNREKELATATKNYDDEIIRAKGNADIIATINEARFVKINSINDKYDSIRIAKEDDLYSKIEDIQDRGFTSNINSSKRVSEKNKEILNNRLKDVSDYFDKLRKLNTNGDLGNIVLGITEKGVKKNITTKADNSNKPDKDQALKVLGDLASGFGTKFFQTLTTINQQADQSFSGIITEIGSSLGTMLNDVFSTQLSGILKNLVDGTKVNTTQAISAIAGVVGGLISGITSKTSSVGQAAGGALTGAGSGALIGSAFGPGPGTVIGAVAGGLIGAIGGLFGASKARKEQEALQKQQLEEAKKQTELMRQNALTYTAAITGRMTDQGILTNVDIGAMGELKATVSGKQIDFILARNNNSRG